MLYHMHYNFQRPQDLQSTVVLTSHMKAHLVGSTNVGLQHKGARSAPQQQPNAFLSCLQAFQVEGLRVPSCTG